MNDEKPNPAAGGRYVLGDDGAHVPDGSAGILPACGQDARAPICQRPAFANKPTLTKREVKNVAAK